MASTVGSVKFSISFQGSCIHELETVKAIDLLFNKEKECAEISNDEEKLTFKACQLKMLSLPLNAFSTLQLSITILRPKELYIFVSKDNKTTCKWQDEHHFEPVKIISKPEDINNDDEFHISVSRQNNQFVAKIECTNSLLKRIFNKLNQFGR